METEITNAEIRDCWLDLCEIVFKGEKINILNVDNTNDDVNYSFHIKYIVGNEITPRTQDLTFTKRINKSGLANVFAIMKKRALEGSLLSPNSQRNSANNVVKKVNKSQQGIKGTINNKK